jgi:molecular chaperone DnaJ
MPESPAQVTPYQVLGVAPTVDHDELRRAYRRKLRETHPDTGGDAVRFAAVQRAWQRVGDPDDRAAYDRGASSPSGSAAWPTDGSSSAWASGSGSTSRQQHTRPRARLYGHPGGAARETYLRLIREWAGRGPDLPDPYDPALVRSAPLEIRLTLAKAIAEEETSVVLADLGIGFTVWNDVDPGRDEDKIDHVVLGPTGLYALRSEDRGGSVSVSRGEVTGENFGDREQPIRSLVRSARALGRTARVKFTGVAIIVPDGSLESEFEEVGRARSPEAFVLGRSRLPHFLRAGSADTPIVGGTESFEVRTRLQAAVRFV